MILENITYRIEFAYDIKLDEIFEQRKLYLFQNYFTKMKLNFTELEIKFTNIKINFTNMILGPVPSEDMQTSVLLPFS